jgi:D-glycero-D-manno-heptose 1,7-bisphosphate phosphatase
VSRAAVFLDRDGVLNKEVGYIHKVEDLVLIEGVAKAVRRLNDAGWFCCMISNQAGPARGYFPVAHVEALHDRLVGLLAEEAGAKLDALYYCPYLAPPVGGVNPEYARWSTWRKPNTGMLIAAAWEHDLDIQRSFMVGDKATDVDLARNAGARGILVRTGYGQDVIGGNYQHHSTPDFTAADLVEAIDWILQQES